MAERPSYPSWVRYTVAVYLGLLLAGAIATPAPPPPAGLDQTPAAVELLPTQPPRSQTAHVGPTIGILASESAAAADVPSSCRAVNDPREQDAHRPADFASSVVGGDSPDTLMHDERELAYD